MTVSLLQGQFYEISPGKITLFGLPGFYSGSFWAVGTPAGDTYVPVEVTPYPVSGEIEQLIAADVAAGKSHLIRGLLVSNRIAVCLFLEGVLTFELFQNAVEQVGQITIPVFAVSGRLLTLLIVPETQLNYPFATLDEFGEIV
jgi:hypothetical protein